MNVNGLSIEVLPTAILHDLYWLNLCLDIASRQKIMKKKLKELSREIYG